MGKSQRTKGAVYERDVAQRFTEHFGRAFKRNIGQARDGGNDLDVGCLVLEMKRRASLKGLRAWLQQAQTAAETRASTAMELLRPAHVHDHIPVVVMREDGGTESMVLLGMNDFLHLAGDKIRLSLGSTA